MQQFAATKHGTPCYEGRTPCINGFFRMLSTKWNNIAQLMDWIKILKRLQIAQCRVHVQISS